jgi:hypothetical protein
MKYCVCALKAVLIITVSLSQDLSFCPTIDYSGKDRKINTSLILWQHLSCFLVLPLTQYKTFVFPRIVAGSI